MTDLWNTRRQTLQNNLIQAALDLAGCTGAAAAAIPVPDTMPQMYVVIGDAAAIPRLLPHGAATPALPVPAILTDHDNEIRTVLKNLDGYMSAAGFGVAHPWRAEIATALAMDAQPAAQGAMEALATITLGGIDGDELGDIDIEIIDKKRLEAIQYQMVRTEYPVYLHLYGTVPAEQSTDKPAEGKA